MKKEVPRDEFIRKRMERQRKIRKRRLITFFIFFIITAICVGIALSLTVFFPIENIKAKGSKIYTPEQIINYSQIEKGENLFTVSKTQVEKNLKKNLPYVEKIEIERELSGKIEIIVTDAEEFACYTTDKGKYIVSKSGWVLKKIDKVPEKLIEIKADKVECSTGNQIIFADESLKALVDNIIEICQNENVAVNSVDVTDLLAISLKADGRFDVNLGNNDNIERKIKHLAGMIEKIPEKKSGKINLNMWTTTNTQGTFTEKKGK